MQEQTKPSKRSGSKPSWSDRISALLVRGKLDKALAELDRIAASTQLQLFDDAELDRELAWLYRINLLRDSKRMREALAWVCLECDVNPGNIAAMSLRIELKQQLGYLSPPGDSTVVSDAPESPEWEGVAGMRELKAILERDVIQPVRYPRLYAEYGLSLPNGILLYGPPGCGKTHIARALSRTVSYSFKEVSPSDLASIYVHGTQEKIRGLFDEAAQSAPCILFLDELDAFVPNRGHSDLGFHYAAEVNEFLVQLNKCSKKGILIIGATNRIDSLDPALLRPGRLDKKILVGPPDAEARAEVISLYLKNRPLAPRIDLASIALATPFYTPAELEHVVNEAARLALPERSEISEEHLLTAVGANPAALDQERMLEYQRSVRPS